MESTKIRRTTRYPGTIDYGDVDLIYDSYKARGKHAEQIVKELNKKYGNNFVLDKKAVSHQITNKKTGEHYTQTQTHYYGRVVNQYGNTTST